MNRLMTRRFFVGSVGSGVLSLIAVACSSPPPAAPTPSGSAATKSESAPLVSTSPAVAPVSTSPSKQIVNRLVVGSPPPAAEGSNPSRDLPPNDVYQLRPMYEGLIGNDPSTGAFIPQLAESWAIEPDGKSVRFKLRRGVQFQNGFGEFSARDVVYTYQDLLEKDSVSSNAGVMRDLLEDIEVVNDYEIVARAKLPDYGLLFALSLSTGGMEIRSKADAESRGGATTGLDVKPIAGTGPYQFKERAIGQFIRFERVPYTHWRITPDFPEIELRWQPENVTRLASLLAGETHLTSLTRDLLKEGAGRGMAVYRAGQAGTPVALRFLGIYLSDPKDPSKGYQNASSPIMDVRVRRALSKAVDRTALNRLFGDEGETMFIRQRHQSLEGWNPQWEQNFPDRYVFDPGVAKQLLAEAGFGPGNPLHFTAVAQQGNSVEALDVMDSVSSMWHAVGVDAKLDTMEMSVWRQKLRALQFNDSTDYVVSTGYPLLLQFRVITGLNALRGGAFENPDIDEAYRKVIAELTDENLRAKLWREVGDIDYGLHTHVPLFWLKTSYLGNPSVISSYTFPGNLGAFFTHFEHIKAA
jgi:peptide/nickel transport system substrate-binding protein